MIKILPKVTIGKDLTADIQQSLRALGSKDVYVGIPEGDIGSHEGISNAQLTYIMTHGVRAPSMRASMDDMMQLDPSGAPFSIGYNRFLSNMDKGIPYSAAYDMYIHEHGSPLWQVPPRPIIEPALDNSKELVADQLKIAAQTALSGKDPTDNLKKAGMVGQDIVGDWFTNPLNRWPQNSPKTIAEKGSSRPLIDTDNLRNSITYVVKEKK